MLVIVIRVVAAVDLAVDFLLDALPEAFLSLVFWCALQMPSLPCRLRRGCC